MRLGVLVGVVAWVAVLGARAGAQDAKAQASAPFELKDGDRVVIVGGALAEREQAYGHIETMLTTRWPDRKVTFRNLGWSGDTVWGEARAGFGTAEDGFKALQKWIEELKPTVVILAYGGNEAHAGEAGLSKFREGLDRLLGVVESVKPREVLVLSPLKLENLGPPLPDPEKVNVEIERYAGVLGEAASARGWRFVDLNRALVELGGSAQPITDDGVVPTAYGYWKLAQAVERALGIATEPVKFEIQAQPFGRVAATGDVTLKRLPRPAVPPEGKGAGALPGGLERSLKVGGLKDGKYTLIVDGLKLGTADAKDWAAGLGITRGPEFDKAERLRRAIVAKNELFFHRYRPQNDTYLFGFRKHEQGNNAVEIPQFDPLVAKAEAEIARLRQPEKHSYILIREEDKR